MPSESKSKPSFVSPKNRKKEENVISLKTVVLFLGGLLALGLLALIIGFGTRYFIRQSNSPLTYSQILKTYPKKTKTCNTIATIISVDETGEKWKLAGVIENPEQLNGLITDDDMQVMAQYYGTKITTKVPIKIGGKTYPAGTKLTVDKYRNWVEVSSWE